MLLMRCTTVTQIGYSQQHTTTSTKTLTSNHRRNNGP